MAAIKLSSKVVSSSSGNNNASIPSGGTVAMTPPADWTELVVIMIGHGGGGNGANNVGERASQGSGGEAKMVRVSRRYANANGFTDFRISGGTTAGAGAGAGESFLQAFNGSTWTTIAGVNGGNAGGNGGGSWSFRSQGRVSNGVFHEAQGAVGGNGLYVIAVPGLWGGHSFDNNNLAEYAYIGGADFTPSNHMNTGRGGGSANYNNAANSNGSGSGSPGSGGAVHWRYRSNYSAKV